MHAIVNANTGRSNLVTPNALRSPKLIRRKLWRLGFATVLATGVVAAATVAQARITNIQILNSGTAFGGYSFPGVGQYEFITGIATGEVNPSNPQNAVITDIANAPTNPNGTVGYQHNFYILKPLDLSKGNHKMMYEPPNRGGKTYQTLNNTPTGTNDPAALTDPTVLANSFLWPRGYTTVWSGWENNLGPLSGLTATATLPTAHGFEGATLTGPGYEYIVTGASTFALHVSRRIAEPGSTERCPDAPRALGRHARGCSNQRLGLHGCEQYGDQVDTGAFRQQRHLRVLVHRKQSYSKRDRTCCDTRLQLVPALRER